MQLKVLLPFGIFADQAGVARVVAQMREGSFELLPHRLDCVAALVPGILVYQCEAQPEVYVAVDEGVLVKSGAEVLISVRRAVGGTDLRALHEKVKREFLVIDAQAREVRAAVARMEAAFVGRFAEFQHGR